MSSKKIKVVIEPAKNKTSKLTAIFTMPDGKTKRINFGARGALDYTLHDKSVRDERRRLYDIRHKKREDWTNPFTAGALSKWILWNLPTRSASIQDFKKRFNLA